MGGLCTRHLRQFLEVDKERDDALEVERLRTEYFMVCPDLDPSGGCWSKARLELDRACPNRENHIYGPPGYVTWHAWAGRMKRMFHHRTCPGCGHYMLLEPKERDEP